MSDRDHLSIGEVLTLLAEEFPDITVSKIRFLESRGLIAPERTPSGYRKFYEADVERLRWILTQQKVHFLPLRVIRERLDQESFDFDDEDDDLDDDSQDARPDLRAIDGAGGAGPADPAPVRPAVFTPLERTLALTLAELADKSGLPVHELRDLERQGLLVATAWGDEVVYDDEALAVATLAARFRAFGVDGRHLRMYKLAAEREAGVYEQLVIPLLKRDAEGRAEAVGRLEELAAMGEEMRAAMLRLSLRNHLP
jgi:DNA-binding transcriptional MerR regulator